MALFHDATVDPSKPDMLAAWIPNQPWAREVGACDVEVLGAFRFDDPEGQVGLECFVVGAGAGVLFAPMTYRAEPLAGAEAHQIAVTEHSALGPRWVYDGLADPVFVRMLAAVAMTGQGEALGMVTYDGVWHIAPATARLQAGGWTGPRVSVDGLAADELHADVVEFRSDTLSMTVHRRPTVRPRPPLGLAASWQGQSEPVVLAVVAQT